MNVPAERDGVAEIDYTINYLDVQRLCFGAGVALGELLQQAIEGRKGRVG
jgi:hypothetical protein